VGHLLLHLLKLYDVLNPLMALDQLRILMRQVLNSLEQPVHFSFEQAILVAEVHQVVALQLLLLMDDSELQKFIFLYQLLLGDAWTMGHLLTVKVGQVTWRFFKR
jgi:hypothetical protein